LAVALYLAFAVIQLVQEGEAGRDYHWDFQTYYWATTAYLQGIDPYDTGAVKAATRHDLHNFFYFPLSLHLFAPLTRLSFNIADLVFLCIQCCLLVYSVCIWQIIFLEKFPDPWFLLFCLLAFNSTIYLDLGAGNVSIVEQAALWTAFYFFAKQRFVLFSVFVVLAAIFKLTPLFFGLLLLSCGKDQRFRALAVLALAVFLIFAIAWLAEPRLFMQFLSRASTILELPSDYGIISPAPRQLIKSFVSFLARRDLIVYPLVVQWSLYLSVVFVIAGLTWNAFRNLDVSTDEDAKFAINLMCLLFVLVSPRLKDYSYIVLLLPTYFIMQRISAVRAYPLLFILSVLSIQNITLPGFDSIARVLWSYYPLGIAILIWIIYLVELRARDKIRQVVS